MVTAALISLLALPESPTAVSAKIVGASLFKNGYAVVVREIPVERDGTYLLADVPQASLGTLWFSFSSQGNRGKLVEITSTTAKKSNPYNFASLEQILRGNVGKTLTLTYNMVNGPQTITGVLKSAEGSLVVIEAESKTLAIQREVVTQISSEKGGLVYGASIETTTRGLRFRTTGGKGAIVMVGLEQGLSWAPSYAVDITDKKKLTLVAKATILNDLDNLKEIELKLITGFPNVPYAQFLDPLISGQSIGEFGNMLNGIGQPGIPGGIGGMLTQNAVAPAARFAVADMAVSVPSTGAGGDQKEDLFFYKQPGVTLDRNDRGSYTMFQIVSDYEELYALDLDDSTINNVDYRGVAAGPQDVWHSLKFKNNGAQPLTTGVATTFSGGEVVGQDKLSYIPVGGDAELKINKSLDIRAETTEEEESRERGAIKNGQGYPLFDLVTVKGTLEATNLKPVKIKFRVRKDLTGEVIEAPEKPVVTKTTRGLSQVNTTSRLIWNSEIEPGKKLNLSYIYKLYVRTQG